jgi:hypothetical protein
MANTHQGIGAFGLSIPFLIVLAAFSALPAIWAWPRNNRAVPKLAFGVSITGVFWSYVLGSISFSDSVVSIGWNASALFGGAILAGSSAAARAVMASKAKQRPPDQLAVFRRISDVLLALALITLATTAVVVFTSGVDLASIPPTALLALIPPGFAIYARSLDSCLPESSATTLTTSPEHHPARPLSIEPNSPLNPPTNGTQ